MEMVQLIRRREDGSIDLDHYIRISHQNRSRASIQLVRGLLSVAGMTLGKLPSPKISLVRAKKPAREIEGEDSIAGAERESVILMSHGK